MLEASCHVGISVGSMCASPQAPACPAGSAHAREMLPWQPGQDFKGCRVSSAILSFANPTTGSAPGS